jgi:capsular exopolysaccharide synthesis family protein
MNDLKKYDGQQVIQELARFEGPAEKETETNPSIVKPILERWRIMLLTFLLACLTGLPAIWLVIKPYYEVTGAIRVAPIITNILSGEADRGEISNYQSFMNTQAEMITSTHVIQRVADELAGRNLEFFGNKTTGSAEQQQDSSNNTDTKSDPAAILKNAVTHKTIYATPGSSTELLKITMQTRNQEEGKQIVNAFIRAYMAVEVSSSIQGQDNRLTVLENERRALTEKLQRYRDTIRQMAQEYGTTALEGRQDMMLQRVASLLAELTKAEANRIHLEAQVQLLEKTKEPNMVPDELLQMRTGYINDDPMVQILTQNIVQMEQQLIIAKQTLNAANPELKRKAELLEALKTRLEQRKEDLGKSFEELVKQETINEGNRQFNNTRTELAQTAAYENRLREMLSEEDNETIEIGRKQLTIRDIQDQLDITKDYYDTVSRRIQEMEMERKRPARISVAYDADIASTKDKRIKYSAALVFAAMALGGFLALVRDKTDPSLRSPEDVLKRTGVRMIGTTINSNYYDTQRLPQQMSEDYQTIRANLGLLNGDGIPKKLVVTSAGTRDGKTTFAINLATSLSKVGKKILLIDGDLRKPDIRRLLNLPKNSKGLQAILLGNNFDTVLHRISSTKFDVLIPESKNGSDTVQLLSQPCVSEYLNKIGEKYDHVIIDTPPVLAFPDALLWAKVGDGVILTSFAGRTSNHDLKETLERLRRINVNILGTVLHNVRTDYSYNRYAYNYYAKQNAAKNGGREGNNTALMLPNGQV